MQIMIFSCKFVDFQSLMHQNPYWSNDVVCCSVVQIKVSLNFSLPCYVPILNESRNFPIFKTVFETSVKKFMLYFFWSTHQHWCKSRNEEIIIILLKENYLGRSKEQKVLGTTNNGNKPLTISYQQLNFPNLKTTFS